MPNKRIRKKIDKRLGRKTYKGYQATCYMVWQGVCDMFPDADSRRRYGRSSAGTIQKAARKHDPNI